MSCSSCGTITLFKGEDGKTILSGSRVTSAGLGTDGDFYIDTDAWEIYGPKTSGAWGAGTSLVGTAGSQGNYGGWSSEWLYDGTSTAAGTSVGDFRFDNGTLSAVTKLYINDTNADSANLQAFLDAWDNSGAFGLVRISKKTDPNVFWMGIVTAESDTGSEHDVTVTYVVSNGTFTDNDPCVVSFVESGIDGINGTNGADATDLYDSDWVTIGAHNGTFGLPNISNWTNPKLRVIGRQCYITGYVLLPLATAGAPTVLLGDASVYPTTQRTHVQIYTGTAGGFTVDPSGGIQSVDSLVPTDLQPTETVHISRHQMVERSIQDTGGTRNLNLVTICPRVDFNTSGKLFITTWLDLLDSAGAISSVDNTPVSMLIMNVDAGEKVINFSKYKHQFVAGVESFEIVDSGDGYTDGTHTGVTTTSDISGGTGKEFTVVVDAGKIVSITETTTGSGYTDGETLTLDAASGTPGIGTPTANIIATIRIDYPSDADDRTVLVNAGTYPATFDGKDPAHLGGFVFPFTISYPLDPSLTEAQITAAIASM
jgi:hypothetical protein